MDSLDPEDAARFLAWSEEELAEWRMDRIAQLFDAKVAPLLARIQALEAQLNPAEPARPRPGPPPRFCTLPGCDRKHHGGGLCQRHYHIALRERRLTSQPQAIVSLSPPPEGGHDQAA